MATFPLWMAPAAAAGPVLKGVVTNGGLTSAAVTCPATVVGDVIILQLASTGAANASIGVPAGFTIVAQSVNTSQINGRIAFKYALGTEGGTTLTYATPSTTGQYIGVQVWSGVDVTRVSPFDQLVSRLYNGAAPPTSRIAPANINSVSWQGMVIQGQPTRSGIPLTTIWDVNVPANGAMISCYEVRAAAGSTPAAALTTSIGIAATIQSFSLRPSTQTSTPVYMAQSSIASVAATPITPGWPTGITNGDWVVYAVAAKRTAGTVTVPALPTGTAVAWTQIQQVVTGITDALTVFATKYTTGDTAPTFTGPGGSQSTIQAISNFRGCASSAIDGSGQTSGTSATFTSPTLTTTINCDVVIDVWHGVPGTQTETGAPSQGTWSDQATTMILGSGSNHNLLMTSYIQGVAGGSTATTTPRSASGAYQSISCSLKPV